jgi:hypothetical protein
MKRFLPVVFSGVLAVSFSQIALAQGVNVQGPAGTGAAVDLEKQKLPDANTNVQNTQQSGDQNQNSQTGSGSTTQHQAAEDKNPDSPGKGWAKGHERGKGHGANDERHGGRHSGSGGTSERQQSGDQSQSMQSGSGSTSQKQESERKY